MPLPLDRRDEEMGRRKRRELFISGEVGVYHCTQRAVRRALLCGDDPVTGKSFDYRRDWVQDRLRELAGSYGFDCLSYAVMQNHVHVVVRNRPDIIALWTNEQVAIRWWKLFPGRRNEMGEAAVPDEADLKPLLVPERSFELRRRLGDISWLMRSLAEPIARRANKEDNCTGRFWEGRFKCQKLADAMAVLACNVYVDLNPIRARCAMTPEECLFTSIYKRIMSRTMRKEQEDSEIEDAPDEWLAPVEIDERAVAYEGPVPSQSGKRVSDKGFVNMDLDTYLEFVDWTGRQLRRDPKRGRIPPHLEPILQRLGIAEEIWCVLVGRFGKVFKQVAGTPVTLAREAKRLGNKWLQSSGSPLAGCPS